MLERVVLPFAYAEEGGTKAEEGGRGGRETGEPRTERSEGREELRKMEMMPVSSATLERRKRDGVSPLMRREEKRETHRPRRQ